MAPQALVAVDGQYKPVIEAYVAVDGEYKPVPQMLVAVDGEAKTSFSPGAEYFWVLVPVGGNPWKWTLTLNAANASRAVIRGSWRSEPLATVIANVDGDLSWTSTRGPGTPRTVYKQWVELYDSFGRLTEGVPVLSYTPPSPPTPPAPTFSSVTETAFTASIPEQTVADQYHWDVVSPPSGTTYTDRTLRRTGMKSGTRYGVRVRTIFRGVGGSWSKVGYTTTKTPSYTKGTYTLNPSGSFSYSPSFNTVYWRPASEGLRAGSANPWTPAPNRGTQSGWIFYKTNDSTHRTLRTALSRGAKVTGVEIYLRRRNTAHGYGGTDPRANLAFRTHNYGSKPGGRPRWSKSWGSGHGWSRGQGRWVSLPKWMGKDLINGGGLAIGGNYSPYYLFEGVGWGSTGKVRITIQ